MSAVARTCPVPRCASLQHLFHCLYLVLNDVIINCHWSLGIPWLVYWLVIIWINLIQWIFQGWLSYHPSRTDPISTIHAAYNTSVVVESQPGHILQNLFTTPVGEWYEWEYLFTCSGTKKLTKGWLLGRTNSLAKSKLCSTYTAYLFVWIATIHKCLRPHLLNIQILWLHEQTL